MREFMTKVSDYFNEWREDPEKGDGQIPPAVLIVVGIAVAAIIALLLWWGYSVQEKRRDEAAKKAQELQEAQVMQEAQDALALQEAQGLVANTYEEKMQEYMSRDSGEELRQEYLANTNELEEKVRELQSVLENVQKEVTEVTVAYRSSNSQSSGKVTEKLTALEKETKAVADNAKTLETRVTALSDAVQRMDQEKITVIQGQIGDIKVALGQLRTDVSGIHETIKELRKEDEKLWNQLSKVEERLKKTVSNGLNDLDNRLDEFGKDMDALEISLRDSMKEMQEKNEEENRELDERQRKSEEKNRELDERQKRSEEKNQELDERQKKSEEKNRELDERQKKSEEKNQEWNEKMSEKIAALSSESLSYRYEEKTNTLYLLPGQSKSGR